MYGTVFWTYGSLKLRHQITSSCLCRQTKPRRPAHLLKECFKMAAGSGKKEKGGLSQEQIIIQFNQLRQEQRALLTKIAELEAEVGEHG